MTFFNALHASAVQFHHNKFKYSFLVFIASPLIFYRLLKNLFSRYLSAKYGFYFVFSIILRLRVPTIPFQKLPFALACPLQEIISGLSSKCANLQKASSTPASHLMEIVLKANATAIPGRRVPALNKHYKSLEGQRRTK